MEDAVGEIGTILMGLKGMTEGPLVGFMFLFYHLHPIISLYECVAGGIVLGYCLAAWASFICCAMVGGTSALAVRFSYTMLSLATIYYAKKILERPNPLRSTLVLLRREIEGEAWLNILLVLCSIFFWRVFYIHTIYMDSQGNLWSGGSTWSDLSFHLNVINSYIYGQNQIFSLWSTPRSMIFAGSGMSYPFIPDWHSTSLVVAGACSVRWAILLPSFFISLSFVVLLFSFVRRFLSYSEKALENGVGLWGGTAFLAGIVFLTLSGVGGFTTIRSDLPEWSTWERVLEHDNTQYTDTKSEIFWFHPVCHVLLPQRSALFAYPLVLLVSSCIFLGVNPPVGVSLQSRRKLFLISGFITGLLPLVHAHSLVCLAMIFIPYALLHPIRSFSINKETGLFVNWLRFGIPIVLESLMQIPVYMDRLVTEGGSNSSFLTYKPIISHGQWQYYHSTGTMNTVWNFFILWGRAIGPFLPLAILGTLLLNGKQLKLYLSFWVVFVVSNLIQFQPWEKDNTKMFLIWVFLAVAVVALVITKLWRAPFFFTKLIAVVLVISMVLSGTMMLYRESTLWWQFMDPEDQKFGEWVAANSDGEDVFIVNDSHIHPATNLAGKTALVNMAGWVQSHGYPQMWSRYSDMRSMLSRPDQFRHLYQRYNISYIAQDWRLAKDNGMDLDFFQFSEDVKQIYASSKYTVFDVRGLHK